MATLYVRATWEDSVKRSSLDRSLAKQNPARVFDSPLDIVRETLFTKGEKLGTLNRWRQTVLEETSANGQGMRAAASDRARILGQIEEAESCLR